MTKVSESIYIFSQNMKSYGERNKSAELVWVTWLKTNHSQKYSLTYLNITAVVDILDTPLMKQIAVYCNAFFVLPIFFFSKCKISLKEYEPSL